MKLLVTGGTGYAGAILISRLLALRYQVRFLDNPYGRSLMSGSRNLLSFFSHPQLEFIFSSTSISQTGWQARQGDQLFRCRPFRKNPES